MIEIIFTVFLLTTHSKVFCEIFEGDIELSKEQRQSIYSNNGFAGPVKTTLWPTTIPYEIDQSLILRSKIPNGITEALKELEEKTCLRFVKRTNETGYLIFKFKKKPSSPLGFVSIYPRVINLNHAVSKYKGQVLHHLMHVLGFLHESNRHDRDAYVKVLWDNINRDKWDNFKKYDGYATNSRYLNIPYDYDSITHPHRYWMGSVATGPTLQTVDYYQRYKIGQRKGLSELDVLSVNLVYRCPGTTKSPRTIPPAPTDHPEPEVMPRVETKTVCDKRTDYIRCPSDRQLWIESAMYGRQNKRTCISLFNKNINCSAPQVFEKIMQKCQGNIECKLQAYSRDFGDPCPNIHKYLQVSYRCAIEDNMCFSAGKTISCPDGQVLKILDASYGRQSRDICPTIYVKDDNCEAENSLQITRERCEGKQSCKIISSRKVYGDPCPGTLKYLHVIHQCVLKENL